MGYYLEAFLLAPPRHIGNGAVNGGNGPGSEVIPEEKEVNP